MRISSISLMTIHSKCVKLLQTSHRTQKQNYHTPSLNSFNSSAKYIWSNAFEVLENNHAKSVTQNSMAVFIVAVVDVSCSDEQLEGIIHIVIV